MARPRYQLKNNDCQIVLGWLENKIINEPMRFPVPDNYAACLKARRELDSASHAPSGDLHIELNAWAERWLTREQWTQLKNALRVAKYRGRHRGVNGSQNPRTDGEVSLQGSTGS